jgi:hypothetical protein
LVAQYDACLMGAAAAGQLAQDEEAGEVHIDDLAPVVEGLVLRR